jgi:hypothetical protein
MARFGMGTHQIVYLQTKPLPSLQLHYLLVLRSPGALEQLAQ